MIHVKCLLQDIGYIECLVNVDKCPIKFWGRTIGFLAHDHHLWYAHLSKPI